MKEEVEVIKIKNRLAQCYKVYFEYFWLIDSYVLDFFTHNHWGKLPHSWAIFFANIQPKNLANVLKADLSTVNVPPLSLIALQTFLSVYNLPRKNFNYVHGDIERDSTQLNKVKESLVLYKDLHSDSKILKLFWKHVKPKKQHEIDIMAKETFEKAVASDCDYIIDVGSGLGHLARMLSFGYGLKVCGIELQDRLTTFARELDSKFEATALKYCANFSSRVCKPIHINLKIDPEMDPKEFENLIKEAFRIKDPEFRFGIVGLHTCGDLGVTLLRLFGDCERCKFINFVGCCYMKLTTKIDNLLYGYPLSNFCRNNNFSLSYNSREVACHSIETYIERLQAGYHWELKIHAYRAVLEKLIVTKWPNKAHCPLANVKYTEDLTFKNYCQKALKKLDLHIEDALIQNEEIQEYLQDWIKVVVYYSLRLQLAPLLETIILLDRLLFMTENGWKYDIKSAFDPKVSPRNFVITAVKT